MAVGNAKFEARSGSDGQFTVQGSWSGALSQGRVIRIRRPFALIGQIPGADRADR